MQLIFALVSHCALFFRFKHPLKGLPSNAPVLLMTLAFFYVVLNYFYLNLLPSTEKDPYLGVSGALFALLVLLVVRERPAFILLLPYIGARVLAILALIILPQESAEPVSTAMLWWGVAAAVVGFMNYTKLLKEDHKNNSK